MLVVTFSIISGPDTAKILADRVQKLSHELFDELVTQVPNCPENLSKVSPATSSPDTQV